MKLSWALAVSGDLDVDELGNSDDWDTGVQDDAEKFCENISHSESLGLNRLVSLYKVILYFTYSEAMLISGASKQISFAIFLVFQKI